MQASSSTQAPLTAVKPLLQETHALGLLGQPTAGSLSQLTSVHASCTHCRKSKEAGQGSGVQGVGVAPQQQVAR